MSVKISFQLKQNLLRKVLEPCVKFYNAASNFLFYLPCGGETSFRENCVQFAELIAGDRVLDLCCGTGEMAIALAEQGLSVDLIGVDASERAIEIAKIKDSCIPTFLRASAADLPFKSSRFDKCFISFGLHHMSKHERQKALTEVRRTLSPEGALYVIDYNLPEGRLRRLAAIIISRLDKSKEAHEILKQGGLIGEIKQAGFKITKRASTCQGIVQFLEAIKQ